MYEEIEVICKEGGDVSQVFNEGEVFFLNENYYKELFECTLSVKICTEILFELFCSHFETNEKGINYNELCIQHSLIAKWDGQLMNDFIFEINIG
jgi:hypothetical protein